MNAIETAFSGLIDYAGLYPPASLDMTAAIRNYFLYRNGPQASMLGRFIVDLDRLNEMREVAGSLCRRIRLSVLAPANTEGNVLEEQIERGYRIEAIECRTADPSEIERIARSLPTHVEGYFELPWSPRTPAAIESFASTGCRVKLRTGGIVADAIPTSEAVVAMLRTLSHHRIPFKATAGLHHPLRSRHALGCAAGSATGMMHGFINLLGAAALIHHEFDNENAIAILEEQDPRAWRVTRESIQWRDFSWTAEQMQTVRQTFFISFGSCSFTEPVHDLEALTWL